MSENKFFNSLNSKHFFFFLFILWIFSFPSKGAVYQLSLYLIVALFFLNLKKVLENDNFLIRHLVFFIVILVFPVLLSDFFRLLGDLSNGFDLEFYAVYIIRVIVFPLVVVSFFNFSDTRITWFIYLLILSCIFHAIAGIYEFIPCYVEQQRPFICGRMSGWVFNPNPFGLLMAFGAVLSIFQYFTEKKIWVKVGLVFTFFLLFYCCLHSGSRGAFVALLVGCSSLFVKEIIFFEKKKKIFLYLLIFIGGLIVFLMFIPSYFFDSRIDNIFNDPARISIWKSYANILIEKKIFGYGSLDFPTIYYSGSRISGPHNLFIEILYRSGILGFITFMISIYFLFKNSFLKNKILLPIFLVIFVSSLFDHSFYESSIFQSFVSCLIIFHYSRDERKLSVQI